MTIDTKTGNTLTWQDYVADLMERRKNQVSTRDSGSWYSPHAESTCTDFYYYDRLLPVSPPPGRNLWMEPWTPYPANPGLVEGLYAPNRGVKYWLMWQRALREQEEVMRQMERGLSDNMRRQWDYRSGGDTWASYRPTRKAL